jgi:hypothetical protein
MVKGFKLTYSRSAFLLLSVAIVLCRLLCPRTETGDITSSLPSHFSGFTREGFSLPFQVSFPLGLISVIAGIWFLRKILLSFFSDVIAALTIVLIVIAGNYLQLVLYHIDSPHNYLFTIYALIVWLTILWHERPGIQYAVLTGIATGLAALVSPAGAVILIVPLMWGISGRDSFHRKWQLIRSNRSQVVISFLIPAAVVLVQVLFLEIRSGNTYHEAYGPDKQFQWIAPYLWQVLFPLKEGGFSFVPLIIFPLAGFYFLADKNRDIFFSIFLFFLLNLLIIASWPATWNGISPGQFALAGSYVILAIPLGYLVQWIASLKPLSGAPFYIIFLFLILLNLVRTWQFKDSITGPKDITTEQYFLKNAGEFNLRVITDYDFESEDFPIPGNLVTDIVRSGKCAFRMDTGMRFSPGLHSTYGDLDKKLMAGLRVTVWVCSKVPFSENPGSLVATSNHDGLAYRYETVSFGDEKLNQGQWNKVTMYYLAPESPEPEDLLQSYVWYRGEKEMYIDDLKIELIERKK